jgi:HAD superfamily hydrolase (TIGR01490 family)
VKRIAFFDFDGTITIKDSLFEMIKHQKGKTKFFAGLLINAPVLIGLKVKLISNQRAKEQILKYFFRGAELSAFQEGCDKFVTWRLPLIVRPGALEEISKLKESGFEIVVVSASAENWIKKWADQMGLGLISTQLETTGNKLTGKIAGKNCNGEEKALRIRAAYNLDEFDEIYSYGDSSGDNHMLALGTKAFYQPFR